jgi:hypothetical protein
VNTSLFQIFGQKTPRRTAQLFAGLMMLASLATTGW